MTEHPDTILVVDDTPGALGFLTTALEQAGFSVLVAVDGDSALSILARIRPSLVLMDAVMPGLDGFETCRRLKQMPGLDALPVIFMTGLSETEHVVRGLEAGGVDYVTKPIIAAELIARIRVHLGNARVARSTRAALDTTGGCLFAVTARGGILWQTPQAEILLRDTLEPGPDGGQRVPHAVADWLAAGAEDSAPYPVGPAFAAQTVRLVARLGVDELLLSLIEQRKQDPAALLREALGVTARESEVLLWLAYGKTSRDIAEILGMKVRTVDKHLEQIYAKLGVENRTAAASIALHLVGGR